MRSKGAGWGTGTPSSTQNGVPSETEVCTDCVLVTRWVGRAPCHLHAGPAGPASPAGSAGSLLCCSPSRGCGCRDGVRNTSDGAGAEPVPRVGAGAPCVLLGSMVAVLLWLSRPGSCVRGGPFPPGLPRPALRAASRPPTFLTVVPGCLGSCRGWYRPCRMLRSCPSLHLCCPAACLTGVPAPFGAGRTE